MFSVIVTRRSEPKDKQFDFKTFKAAKIKFYKCKSDGDVCALTIVHQTRRVDAVIAFWERNPAGILALKKWYKSVCGHVPRGFKVNK